MPAVWTRMALTLGIGVALGAVVALSPLALVVAGLAVVTVAAARRGLPAGEPTTGFTTSRVAPGGAPRLARSPGPSRVLLGEHQAGLPGDRTRPGCETGSSEIDERRWLTAMLVAALALRAIVVAALSVASIPLHDDQNAGVLFGDEAYSLARSLRTRNILLGIPASKYDYQVMFDTYAKTSYMSFLSWVQLTFGPSPYAVRLLNGVLFVAGAALLYRFVRRAFGVVPALGGLAALLFLPSLFFWSISLLKESAYFLLTSTAIAATVLVFRVDSWRARAAGGILLAVCLWALADLRPGALMLTGGGLALGLVVKWFTGTRTRLLAGALAMAAVSVAVVSTEAPSARVLGALTQAAKQHTGHVFTVGHAYKTLDDRFYATVETPSTSTLTLNGAEATRYVVRSGLAFLTVPFPWQVVTRSELVFMPEQIVWYLLVLMTIVGLRPAWQRDPLVASLLIGYVLPISAALALTNGNVGTLVRLRGLVTPFLVWTAALGCAVAVRRLISREAATR